jgi:hypothetical protein
MEELKMGEPIKEETTFEVNGQRLTEKEFQEKKYAFQELNIQLVEITKGVFKTRLLD